MLEKILILFAILLLIYFLALKFLNRPDRKLESKRSKKGGVMVCPNCGSTNVRPDLTTSMIAWGGSTRYLCKDCSHSATFFPKMNKSDLDKFRKKIAKRTKAQKKIITTTDVSKGFLGKKVNYGVIIFSIIMILMLPAVSYWFFEEYGGFIAIAIFFLGLYIIIKIINRRISRQNEKKKR